MDFKEPHGTGRRLLRIVICTVIGVVAALLIPAPSGVSWVASALVGFVVASLLIVISMIWQIMRADVDRTKDLVGGLDPDTSIVDVVILIAVFGSLAGVISLLVGGNSSGAASVFEGVVTLLTVISGWFLAHTMFGLRYARHWYNAEADCVDFHMDDEPCYSDFLYMAFAVGATFAISDTDLKTSAIRKIAIKHCWLAYLLGTITIGATINLLAGMAH